MLSCLRVITAATAARSLGPNFWLRLLRDICRPCRNGWKTPSKRLKHPFLGDATNLLPNPRYVRNSFFMHQCEPPTQVKNTTTPSGPGRRGNIERPSKRESISATVRTIPLRSCSLNLTHSLPRNPAHSAPLTRRTHSPVHILPRLNRRPSPS